VGDMAENASRVAWSGAGLSLPRRLLSRRGIRLAVNRLLADQGYRARAQELAAWSDANDGAARAAELVEQAASRASQDRGATSTMRSRSAADSVANGPR